PSLVRLGASYRPTLDCRNRAVQEVFRLMAPRMVGAAAVQAMLWVNTLLASRYEGAVYALTLGFMMMYMAQAAIAQSAATAALPVFSAQYALGKLDDLRSTLLGVLRAEILLSLPATAGLILLGEPIIRFLYERGEFTPRTTEMVAWALAWYATGLLFHSVLEVLVRVYYAMHDTKTPVLVGTTAMMLSIGLSVLFSHLFEQAGWMPHGGLALAVSVSTALETGTLFVILHRKLPGLDSRLVGSLVAGGTGTLGMSLALLGWQQVIRSAPAAWVALGGVGLGASIYFLLLFFLKVPEARLVVDYFKRLVTRPGKPDA
ncbi:MAG: lipid II flippase MurJ, partial [Anaerolineales bacterium]|nr:lipid II flippase MurJ [Anaerolineales bacterium]